MKLISYYGSKDKKKINITYRSWIETYKHPQIQRLLGRTGRQISIDPSGFCIILQAETLTIFVLNSSKTVFIVNSLKDPECFSLPSLLLITFKFTKTVVTLLPAQVPFGSLSVVLPELALGASCKGKLIHWQWYC